MREPTAEAHTHFWCTCFGACVCNKAYCTSCGAERPMTAGELAEKEAEIAAVRKRSSLETKS